MGEKKRKEKKVDAEKVGEETAALKEPKLKKVKKPKKGDVYAEKKEKRKREREDKAKADTSEKPPKKVTSNMNVPHYLPYEMYIQNAICIDNNRRSIHQHTPSTHLLEKNP